MKSSKLIKTMSLLSGMFSFLLAGCGGLPDDSSSAETPVSSVEEHIHVYDTNNVEWNWNGYESATATFTCIDNDDTQVIDATITSEINSDPTCEKQGVTTYTATVTFEGETYSVRKMQSVEASGHVWDTENIDWQWSDDCSTAAATFTCMRDVSHTETVIASVTSEVTVEPTGCSTPGERTYTATVTFEGETYTDEKTEAIAPVDDHVYGDDGLCTECGEHRPTDGLAYSYDSASQSYSVSGIGTAADTDIYVPGTYDDGTNGTHPVTDISNSAFQNCQSLKNVTLPEGIISIGGSAFYWCIGLAGINIPEGVESIGAETFYSCISLTGIAVPEGVKSIGYKAFYNCKSLAELTLPSTLTSIGAEAFYSCVSVTGIVFREGLLSIGSSAFYYCPSLTSIIIPSTLTDIGSNGFGFCSNLSYIFHTGSEYTLSYSFPNGTMYFYSEEEPTSEGNWWHYVDGVPTVWETTTATE